MELLKQVGVELRTPHGTTYEIQFYPGLSGCGQTGPHRPLLTGTEANSLCIPRARHRLGQTVGAQQVLPEGMLPGVSPGLFSLEPCRPLCLLSLFPVTKELQASLRVNSGGTRGRANIIELHCLLMIAYQLIWATLNLNPKF